MLVLTVTADGLELVRLLLEAGADTALRNPDGMSALDWAEQGEHTAVTALQHTRSTD